MELCYIPSVLLFILGLYLSIYFGKMWWGAGLIVGSIPLFFSILSFTLCKKGNTKTAWVATFGVIVGLSMIMKGAIPITRKNYIN